MPSGTPAPRRHRADAATTTSLPRPLRRVLGAAGLTLALGGSLAFASGWTPDLDDEPTAPAADAAASAVTGRDNVWAQVSRSAVARTSLEAGTPVTFSVSVDGQTVELTSGAATLADALVDHGILVGLDDVVSAPMNEKPDEGATVTISRVGTVFGADTVALPFERVEQETDDLLRGTTRVQTPGVEGSRVTTYVATYENGVEVSRVNQAEILAAAPVNEVVLVGTGEPPPPPPPPPAPVRRPVTTGSSGSSSAATPPRPAAPTQPAPSYSGGDPRAIAQGMVAARGWGSDQFSCLDRLWQRESNWNPFAQNPSSGAYGIPQSLPGSKMATAGADWRTNPVTQMTWGLNYIAGRYGTPCGAWAHSQAVNWY